MYASQWNTMQSLGVQALKNMDRSRRERGKMLDRAGYAPQPTPSTVIHAEPGLNVLRFDGAPRYPVDNAADAPAVLLVPAPIKRAYIWDLSPDVSVARRWLDRGYRVYQAEWAPLADESIDFGLAEARTTYGAIGVKCWIFKGDVAERDARNRALSERVSDEVQR